MCTEQEVHDLISERFELLELEECELFGELFDEGAVYIGDFIYDGPKEHICYYIINNYNGTKQGTPRDVYITKLFPGSDQTDKILFTASYNNKWVSNKWYFLVEFI